MHIVIFKKVFFMKIKGILEYLRVSVYIY